MIRGYIRVSTKRQERGTSLADQRAAAHVAGAVARLLAEDPSLTAAQLRELLTSSARDGGKPGFDVDYGWGVLDPDRSLELLEEQRAACMEPRAQTEIKRSLILAQ